MFALAWNTIDKVPGLMKKSKKFHKQYKDCNLIIACSKEFGRTYHDRFIFSKDGEWAWAGYLIRFVPNTSKLIPSFFSLIITLAFLIAHCRIDSFIDAITANTVWFFAAGLFSCMNFADSCRAALEYWTFIIIYFIRKKQNGVRIICYPKDTNY